jgi:hypothetical protein
VRDGASGVDRVIRTPSMSTALPLEPRRNWTIAGSWEGQWDRGDQGSTDRRYRSFFHRLLSV